VRNVGLKREGKSPTLKAAYTELQAVFGHDLVLNVLQVCNQALNGKDTLRDWRAELSLPGEDNRRAYAFSWEEV